MSQVACDKLSQDIYFLDTSFKVQATSNKQQATSNKQQATSNMRQSVQFKKNLKSL
jgi:hypothetical protein